MAPDHSEGGWVGGGVGSGEGGAMKMRSGIRVHVLGSSPLVLVLYSQQPSEDTELLNHSAIIPKLPDCHFTWYYSPYYSYTFSKCYSKCPDVCSQDDHNKMNLNVIFAVL